VKVRNTFISLLIKEVILFFTKTICEFVKAEPSEPALLEAVTATHLARKYETFIGKIKARLIVL